MKNSLFLILLLTGLFITGCRKDNDTLPPETLTGANTFGCLVNGKVWVPKGTQYNSGANVLAKYSHTYPGLVGYTLIVSANDYNGEPRSFFNIGMDSMKLLTGLRIKLTNKKGMGGATYSVNDENSNYLTYYVSDSLSGEMQITKMDENNQIISGAFWFDAVNRFGEKVEVREGRFDIKYTR